MSKHKRKKTKGRLPVKEMESLLSVGLTMQDLPAKTEDEILDIVLKDGEDLENRLLGYSCDMESENGDTPEDLAVIFEYANLFYVVRMGEYDAELVFISRSNDDAIERMNELPCGYKSVETQIKNMQDMTKDIPGLYFDPKANGWNIKYDHCILVENAPNLEEADIRRNVAKFNAIKEKLQKYGVELNYVYKTPRDHKDNQQYYVFEFSTPNDRSDRKVHIPSSFQGKKRCVVDFFDENWINELVTNEIAAKAWREEHERWKAEQESKLKMPFDYETAKKLFDYLRLDAKVCERCDGTLKYTQRWLKNNMPADFDFKNAIEYVEFRGGYCDCEVLMNASNPEYWHSRRECECL